MGNMNVYEALTNAWNYWGSVKSVRTIGDESGIDFYPGSGIYLNIIGQSILDNLPTVVTFTITI